MLPRLSHASLGGALQPLVWSASHSMACIRLRQRKLACCHARLEIFCRYPYMTAMYCVPDAKLCIAAEETIVLRAQPRR